MDILYILTFCGLLKPKSGGQNRFFNLTNQLKKKYNNITILESKEFMDLNDEKFGVIHGFSDLKISSNVMPLSRDFNLNFIKKVFKIINNNQIDIILFSHPSGIFVTKFLMWLMNKKVPIIYDAHNVESEFTTEIFFNNNKFSKFKQIIIPLYVTILEHISCKYLVDHIIAVSNKDKNTFIKKYKFIDKVSVIPSGCNLMPLISKNESYKFKMKYGLDPLSKIIIFHGSYSHPPNEEAIELIKDFIAPRFEELNKDIQFVVGGSDVPVLETKNFKSVGFIDNIWEFLSMADIAIVPILKGGGTKLKVLDYLSVGLPVVTTKKGIEGIDAEDNEDVIVVDSVDDGFVDKINYFIENEDEMRRIGKNARRLAEDQYDWNKIGYELNNLLEEIH
jgi:glycosyltransferase involved in cell wall biosynthesis